jgi:SAM-dependent methyltransferase
MSSEPPSGPLSKIDATRPHSARIWNYWLGGKDNYAADRQVGDKVREAYPGIVDIALHARAFLGRAVRYLAGEAGIRQFLDVGTGLPTADNTHEVAQRIAPESRIVYVDNDPLVLVHAQALLTSAARGATAYVEADARDPGQILREAARTLDLSQPVALMLLGIMNVIVDDDEAYAIVDHLVNALPPGSYLVFLDGTNVFKPEASARAEQIRFDSGSPARLRSPEQFARFFDGLELLEPGIVSTPRWRPELDELEIPQVDSLCGVALKK